MRKSYPDIDVVPRTEGEIEITPPRPMSIEERLGRNIEVVPDPKPETAFNFI